MTEPLTQLERRVYHYLIDFLAENTYQPSIREIARKFRIKSTKTVSDLLHALEKKGFIERDESRSRGVRILGFQAAGHTMPVAYYGQIHAGEPALLPEFRKGFITVDRRFVPSDDVFFLKVKGESMVGRGILDGDFVLVSPSTAPKAGDIIATRVNGQTAVKLFPAGDAGMLGVVCGVFRPYWDQAPAPVVPAPQLGEPVS